MAAAMTACLIQLGPLHFHLMFYVAEIYHALSSGFLCYIFTLTCCNRPALNNAN